MSEKAETPQKYFPDQFDDEEVLHVFRKHPIVMRKGLVLASVGLLVGPLVTLIMTYTNSKNPPTITFFFGSLALSLVLSIILFSPAWISWFYSLFIVTDQRLIQITQKGLFHRSVVDLGLNQIQMVNYEIAGLQETLLGFGTIMMQTYVGDLIIHDVHHPAKLQKKLLTILRKQGIITNNYPGGQASKTDEEDDVETETETT